MQRITLKHIFSVRPIARGLLTLSLLLSSSWACAKESPVMDPALIQALQQATHDIRDKTTDLDSLVWLSSMSERLENRIKNPFYRVRLLKTVFTEAEIAGLDPQLVLAVIDIESNFDRYALSHAGAQGLMQVMPFWKDVYGRPNDDLYNPLISLRYGCAILRHYMDKYEDPYDALAAYNGSLGRNIYPDKIYKRLGSRWKFKQDLYSSNTSSKVALGNSLSRPLN